jgi:hypothetical protein
MHAIPIFGEMLEKQDTEESAGLNDVVYEEPGNARRAL